MRAAVSVVIPTLNAAAGLPGCLAALMEGVEAGVVRELIIADGGSDDATLTIADEVGARVVQARASRGGQLRQGAAAARGSCASCPCSPRSSTPRSPRCRSR